jgi:adenylate cyclase
VETLMIVRFSDCALDLDRRELRRASVPVHVEPQVFDLLAYLIANRDRVVSKDDIIQRVWSGRIVSDATLSSRINAARQAIGDDGKAQNFIRTIQRRGYRYVGPAVAAVNPAADPGPRPSQALALPDKPSVAVLPFTNLSDDPEQEYFADGLTEDVITALSLWRSFPVIARNSTFAFKGKAVNVQEVGRALAARYVLEGSVRRSAGRVRVAAQLVDAETGHHVWAETFDRELTDVFELQDELTKKIAAIVTPELEHAEYRRLLAQKPHNLDAWQFVQRGTAELDHYTREGNARAREMFARALELDPDYGRAFAGTALSYNRDLMLGYARSREEAADNALQNARKAVALDRSDSFAHSVLGMAHIWSDQQEEARLSFERSVELNPSHGYARASLGNILDLMGRSEEGIAMMEDGIRLNPDAPNMRHIYTFLARALLCAHRHDEAVDWARRGTVDAGNPNAQYLLAASLAHLNRIKEAEVALLRCERIQPGFVAARAAWRPYQDSGRNAHILDGIRKIGCKG